MCNIFPWVGVGLMGGLWALFVIAQVCLPFDVAGAT